jgi:hypothetical protein
VLLARVGTHSTTGSSCLAAAQRSPPPPPPARHRTLSSPTGPRLVRTMFATALTAVTFCVRTSWPEVRSPCICNRPAAWLPMATAASCRPTAQMALRSSFVWAWWGCLVGGRGAGHLLQADTVMISSIGRPGAALPFVAHLTHSDSRDRRLSSRQVVGCTQRQLCVLMQLRKSRCTCTLQRPDSDTHPTANIDRAHGPRHTRHRNHRTGRALLGPAL